MKKLITILSIFLSLSLALRTSGQTPGPFYRQFFYNPYLFNPAFVGINNELEANLVYRQQWANFKDAPSTAGVNVQFPANDRVALGFSVYSDKQVLLRNSNFMATFGYVVPLSANQSLRFGISGGVGVNKLDLTAEELNTNDPVILNASGNNFYVDGNFGVVYTLHGLRVGFALTDIFKSNTFNSESFNEFELSNLRNRLYSASYRFNIGAMDNFSVEPYFLYRETEDGLQDTWEAASILYFKDKVWTGGSINSNNGLALFFGLNVKQKFIFSYSYEFPPFNSGFTSNSSHELHIGVKLSKKSRTQVARTTTPAVIVTPAVDSVATTPEEDEGRVADGGNKNPGRRVEGEAGPENLETPIDLPATNQIVIVEEKPEEVKEAPAVRPKESFTLTPGHYYVVVGVFSVMSHSMKFTKEMLSKGYYVSVALNPKNNYYYVYIHSTLDKEDAKRVRNEYRWRNLFKEAWVFEME
jgi:type IX secretion system PorP/SprF family membrane protein